MQSPNLFITRMQDNNRCELERLDIERHDDFLGMLKGFVMNQVLLAYSSFDTLKVLDVAIPCIS